MSHKEIYNQLSDLCKRYCLISGQATVIRGEDGVFKFSKINNNDYIIVAGCFPDDLILGAFSDYECAVESEGEYDFRALLSYEPSQIGNYPPPNVEVESYMMIEHIEFKTILFT